MLGGEYFHQPHHPPTLERRKLRYGCSCCSVVKSCLTLRLHGLQQASFLCPQGVCANSSPLIQWCYLCISSSTAPFSFCLQLFPTTGSFLMSQLFTLGSQSIGASASVFSMNIQGWFLLGLTGLTSLLSKELSRISSNTTVWKHQFFGAQPSLWSDPCTCTWLLKKPQLWLYEFLSAK